MRFFSSLCILFATQYFALGQSLDSTNLPLVIINTNGQNIPDGVKISAGMKIIANGPGKMNRPADEGNIYSGAIGIEIRGRFSAGLPQKPFAIETRDALGNNLNVPLLGMPKENDWILLPNYNDKSFVRNAMSFQLFREMGHYASRTMHCEVILNGSYEGIYNLTEKIKVDKGRVDIGKVDLDDNGGDSITGGYIFSIDYYDANNSWASRYAPAAYPGSIPNFVYNFPKPEEITVQQKAYIKSAVDQFEEALYSSNFKDPYIGYSGFSDVNSFIDYFIISEISRNVDGYKKSCFYTKTKDSDGGMISAGPVWDFDWAWKDIYDCYIFQQTDGSGWAYQILSCGAWPSSTGWVPRMMEDPDFVSQVKKRYTILRNSIISEKRIFHYMDSVNVILADAQARHYTRWPILGKDAGAPEIGYIPLSFKAETIKMKNWILRRFNWLDDQLLTTITYKDPGQALSNSLLRIFPNPTHNYAQVEVEDEVYLLEVFSFTGQLIYSEGHPPKGAVKVDVRSYPEGFYVIRLTMEGGETISGKLIVE